MSKKDAKLFWEKLDKDPAFRFQIEHSRSEQETLEFIRGAQLQFDAKEFQGVFEEKFHHPLKKEELHKLADEGLIPHEIAFRLPYASNHPHHGE
jgi:hypothetical protein